MRMTDRDEAAAIFDMLVTAAARIGMYSDQCYKHLIEFCEESGSREEATALLDFVQKFRELD